MNRRRFLKVSGAVGLGSTAVLAGCLGGSGPGAGQGVSGDEYPAVDRWLTETNVGGAEGSYEGSLVDKRDENPVQIDVGAQGNGGNLAFEPAAVVVSPGTTVRWTWTGEGGAHNVDADPDEQIGESAYTFSSGDPITQQGKEYPETLDQAGVVLYHCDPHLSAGMKGGIGVGGE